MAYKQTLSDDDDFMKYHVVRPSRNNHSGTFMMKIIQGQDAASYTSLPRTHGCNKQVLPLSKIWNKLSFLMAGM